MAQDGCGELSIIARLGLNPRAVELARARTPVSRRRRTVLDRDAVEGSSRRGRLASRIAPVAPSVSRAGSEADGAQGTASLLEGQRIRAPSGSGSGSGSPRRYDALRQAAPAGINQHFRISKPIIPKPGTVKTTLKSPVKYTYGKQRSVQTPVSNPRRRDIYELEDDGSGPITSEALPITQVQVKECYSEGRESEESEGSAADENRETSQESLSLVEQFVAARKSKNLSPVEIIESFTNRVFYAKTSGQSAQVSVTDRGRTTDPENTDTEAFNDGHKAATRYVPGISRQPRVEIEHNRNQVITVEQGEHPADDGAQQEPLDDLDLEILHLGQEDRRPSRGIYQTPKRARLSQGANNRHIRGADIDDDEEEEVALILPAPKRPRPGRKSNETENKGVRKEIRVPRASKVTERAVADRSERARKKDKNPNGSAERKRKKPRRLPVKELAITSEKMATSGLDENPAELSEDPISQTEDSHQPRKMFNVKLDFPSRRGFRRIEIAHFRVPKSQGKYATASDTSYKDGFEGDEAKPTKMYMPVKQSSRRREAFDKFVIRLPKLTIVAERPCCDEETENQPPRRAKKTKRRPHAEQRDSPQIEVVHPVVENEQDGIVLDNQHLQMGDSQELAAERHSLPEREVEEVSHLNDHPNNGCQAGPSRTQTVHTPGSATSPSKMPQTPVSKESPLDRKRGGRRNDLVVKLNNVQHENAEDFDATLPSTLRISENQGTSQKPEQPVSAKRQILKARQESIQVSQELSLVYVTRRSKSSDESGNESGSESSRESERNSSSNQNEEESSDEEEESESEKSCMEDSPILERIDTQDEGPEELVVVSPEKGTSLGCERVDIQTDHHPSSEVAEPEPTQENPIVANDEQEIAVGEEQVVLQHVQGHHKTPIVDRDSSFADGEDPLDSQETQDDEITPTKLHELAHEVEGLVLTQESRITPTKLPNLADTVAMTRGVAPSSQQVTPGQASRLRDIAVAAGSSLFRPRQGASSRHRHVSFAAGTRSLASSSTQRESQQSYADTQNSWRPQIPNAVDMSFEAGDDIVDTFSSPTPLSSQFRAPGNHQKLSRRRFMVPMGSLRVGSSRPLSPARKTTKNDPIPRPRPSVPRPSQAESVPSQQQSSALEESQISSSLQESEVASENRSHDDPEIPETQSFVLPEGGYFSSATRKLSGLASSPANPSNFSRSRTKSLPAHASHPRFSQHSESAKMPSSEVFRNTVSSPPGTVPRQRPPGLSHSTPSQRSLSAITKQASEKLGTRSGTPLSSSGVRGRIPSLLRTQPPKKQ